MISLFSDDDDDEIFQGRDVSVKVEDGECSLVSSRRFSLNLYLAALKLGKEGLKVDFGSNKQHYHNPCIVLQ